MHCEKDSGMHEQDKSWGRMGRHGEGEDIVSIITVRGVPSSFERGGGTSFTSHTTPYCEVNLYTLVCTGNTSRAAPFKRMTQKRKGWQQGALMMYYLSTYPISERVELSSA